MLNRTFQIVAFVGLAPVSASGAQAQHKPGPGMADGPIEGVTRFVYLMYYRKE
jgi:hypothetical protein